MVNFGGIMDKQKEYMVHIWGGAWNSDANPSIEKDLGIKDGCHYFKTEKEKNDFCKMLDIPKYANQGLARDIKYGYMSHKRTIFVGIFSYKEKEFIMKENIGNLLDNSLKDEILVQGIVDLFIVKDDEIILVDYKYSNSKDEEYLIKKYKNQLKLYKKAIENAYKLPIFQVFLLSLKNNNLIKVEI